MTRKSAKCQKSPISEYYQRQKVSLKPQKRINLLYIASLNEKDEAAIRDAFFETNQFAITPAFDKPQCDLLLRARKYDVAVLAHERMPSVEGVTYDAAYLIEKKVRIRGIPLVVLVDTLQITAARTNGARLVEKSCKPEDYIQAALAACDGR